VVAAVHALKRACEFAPELHLLGKKPQSRSPPLRPRSPLTLTLSRAEQHVELSRGGGESVVSCTIQGGAQWNVLETVAARHVSAENDLLGQTMPIGELAALCGIEPASVARTVRRLNDTLTREAGKKRPSPAGSRRAQRPAGYKGE
jgi:hypothetical protein